MEGLRLIVWSDTSNQSTLCDFFCSACLTGLNQTGNDSVFELIFPFFTLFLSQSYVVVWLIKNNLNSDADGLVGFSDC